MVLAKGLSAPVRVGHILLFPLVLHSVSPHLLQRGGREYLEHQRWTDMRTSPKGVRRRKLTGLRLATRWYHPLQDTLPLPERLPEDQMTLFCGKMGQFRLEQYPSLWHIRIDGVFFMVVNKTRSLTRRRRMKTCLQVYRRLFKVTVNKRNGNGSCTVRENTDGRVVSRR